MKSKEEIEQIYHRLYDKYDHPHYYSFMEGYTQCQEDMNNEITKNNEEWSKQCAELAQELEDKSDKKYTEEDMRKCWNACIDFNKPAGLDSGINYQDFINSLNKQD